MVTVITRAGTASAITCAISVARLLSLRKIWRGIGYQYIALVIDLSSVRFLDAPALKASSAKTALRGTCKAMAAARTRSRLCYDSGGTSPMLDA